MATLTACDATRGRRDLAGIVEFDGPVVSAAELVVTAVELGQRVACVGTDQAMIDAVVSLVAAGHRVKVFEDRPRLVLPGARLVPLDRASLCATLAGSTSRVLRSIGSVPAPRSIRRRLSRLPSTLEHRAGSFHRRRLLDDRWDRRQLTPSRFDRRAALHGADYYRAIDADACELISWPIAGVTSSGIRTCDGLEHRTDWIVVAP